MTDAFDRRVVVIVDTEDARDSALIEIDRETVVLHGPDDYIVLDDSGRVYGMERFAFERYFDLD